ncbi:hypothetical protein [Castellaniella sp.]|jgi:hypothetical protein|uniref:hypothetical protein n=1 Tax=Castellaniella sp. TaxID=1955812 RepID=UPI003C785BB9
MNDHTKPLSHADGETPSPSLSNKWAMLKQDIAKGLADAAAGHVHPFNAQRIAAQGRKRLAARNA